MTAIFHLLARGVIGGVQHQLLRVCGIEGVDFNDDRIYRWYIIQQLFFKDALSVRCLKDSE